MGEGFYAEELEDTMEMLFDALCLWRFAAQRDTWVDHVVSKPHLVSGTVFFLLDILNGLSQGRGGGGGGAPGSFHPRVVQHVIQGER